MADDATSGEMIGEGLKEPVEGLRHRKPPTREPEATEGDKDAIPEDVTVKEEDGAAKNAQKVNLERGTYWLTRIVILRYIAFIYCK